MRDFFFLTVLKLKGHTEASAMHLPEGVGHASFITQKGCKVYRLAWIIFGPWPYPASVLLTSLVGQEAHMSMTRGREFTM